MEGHSFPRIVVLASEPVGGRSQATELPCFMCMYALSLWLYYTSYYIPVFFYIQQDFLFVINTGGDLSSRSVSIRQLY